jgi:hypothetical protein
MTLPSAGVSGRARLGSGSPAAGYNCSLGHYTDTAGPAGPLKYGKLDALKDKLRVVLKL